MHRKLNRFFSSRTPAAKKLSGFTLTEVVVASTLLIIVMVPILKALTNAYLSNSVIEYKTHSLALAQAKLEEIKASSIYNYADNFRENNSSLGGSYLCDVTDNSVNSYLRTITVSVGFDSSGNGNLGADEVKVTLATRIAKRW